MQFNQKSGARKLENGQAEAIVADDDVRELMKEMVLQMRIMNMYLAKIADEFVEEEDLSNENR